MKKIAAIAMSMMFAAAALAASMVEVVDEMKSARREFVAFGESMTIAKLCDYCQDWARECGFDFKIVLTSVKDERGNPYPFLTGAFSPGETTMFDLLKEGCKRSMHFFWVEKDIVKVAPNLPEFIGERIWTDVKGKKIRAKWVGMTKDGNPVFQMASGKNIKIDPVKLCTKDRRYIASSRGRDMKIPYVRHGGTWKSEIDLMIERWNVREREYKKRAKDMITKKSYPKGTCYKVFQAIKGSVLCIIGRTINGVLDYDGELFLHMGLNHTSVADGEKYISSLPLLWLGTYTYTTIENTSKTVNVYAACTMDEAIYIVRKHQHLYDDGDKAFEDDPNEERQRPKSDGIELAGYGSGFFITRDGYFVTNHHVVKEALKIRIKCVERYFDAKVVKVDERADLALLKADGAFEFAELSPNRTERPGTDIFTVGYPQPDLQGQLAKITKGIISSVEGFQGSRDEYQIDAAIQPGNSGGPVADENGYVVGVAVASLRNSSNVNYAIKKTVLQAFLGTIAYTQPLEKIPRPFADAVEYLKGACGLVLIYR